MYRPLREQARSHSGSASCLVCEFTEDQVWERACSRWRWVSRHPCSMCRPLREQARSHSGSASCLVLNSPRIKCGSELARDGGGSVDFHAECTGLREQARSQWICGNSQILRTAAEPWERACSRRRRVRQHRCRMCRPHREQARSHNDLGGSLILRTAAETCGSEPAREGGVSGDIDVECAGLFASRLAPTVIWVIRRFCVQPLKPGGSEPAREGGVSGSIDVECAGLIASRLAPTMDLGWFADFAYSR